MGENQQGLIGQDAYAEKAAYAERERERDAAIPPQPVMTIQAMRGGFVLVTNDESGNYRRLIGPAPAPRREVAGSPAALLALVQKWASESAEVVSRG